MMMLIVRQRVIFSDF